MTLGSNRTAVLRACRETLKRIQREPPVPRLLVEYSPIWSSSTHSGLFKSYRIRGVLETKFCRHVDYLVPFVAAFADRTCV